MIVVLILVLLILFVVGSLLFWILKFEGVKRLCCYVVVVSFWIGVWFILSLFINLIWSGVVIKLKGYSFRMWVMWVFRIVVRLLIFFWMLCLEWNFWWLNVGELEVIIVWF